jgi:Pentapeptide repeats (8 copies)
MPEERQFPRGSRVDDLDLSGVHLHGTNLEGARLTETYLMDADISGDIEGLRLNGVEVEPLVRAELDCLYPDRVKLRASDVAGLREAWSMVERLWAAATGRALRLPEAVQRERVGCEWSIVETLRHLVFATDCWLFRAIRLEPSPYQPWGLPSMLSAPVAMPATSRGSSGTGSPRPGWRS